KYETIEIGSDPETFSPIGTKRESQCGHAGTEREARSGAADGGAAGTMGALLQQGKTGCRKCVDKIPNRYRNRYPVKFVVNVNQTPTAVMAKKPSMNTVMMMSQLWVVTLQPRFFMIKPPETFVRR